MLICLSLICYRVYVSETNGNWGQPFIDIVGLEDPRKTPDPLPLLYFGADEVAKNISYIHLHAYATYGWGCTLDFFDIVRSEVPAVRKCQQKQGTCKPKPQFCPPKTCISSTISWSSKDSPHLRSKGCSIVPESDTMFEDTPMKCVSITAANKGGDFVFDPATDLETCDDTWDENSACDRDVLTLKKKVGGEKIQTFKFNKDHCPAGVSVEMIETEDSGVTGPGRRRKLRYVRAVDGLVGPDEGLWSCFHLKYELCGPNSVSFVTFSGDLFLTKCDGKIMLKEEFDFCG